MANASSEVTSFASLMSSVTELVHSYMAFTLRRTFERVCTKYDLPLHDVMAFVQEFVQPGGGSTEVEGAEVEAHTDALLMNKELDLAFEDIFRQQDQAVTQEALNVEAQAQELRRPERPQAPQAKKQKKDPNPKVAKGSAGPKGAKVAKPSTKKGAAAAAAANPEPAEAAAANPGADQAPPEAAAEDQPPQLVEAQAQAEAAEATPKTKAPKPKPKRASTAGTRRKRPPATAAGSVADAEADGSEKPKVQKAPTKKRAKKSAQPPSTSPTQVRVDSLPPDEMQWFDEANQNNKNNENKPSASSKQNMVTSFFPEASDSAGFLSPSSDNSLIDDTDVVVDE